jgi:anti-sigma B factor antagonist
MPRDLLDSSGDEVSIGQLLRTGFHSERQVTDDAIVLRLHGELDMATAPGLGRQLNDDLDSTPIALVLDLSELTFLDSTGVRVLLSAARRAAKQGCSFSLRSPTRSVAKTLRLTGVDRMIVLDDWPTS